MREFKRSRHRLVWQVLEALDSEVLEDTRCFFGGGTRIVLELDEYRDSLDVDFLCSDRAGYRTLRNMITQRSFGALFATDVELARDIRADMYGIRTYLRVGDEAVKFEIVSEGRIDAAGHATDRFPVPALNWATCIAEKLLANTDRGRDTSSQSRDIIDLAFMRAHWPQGAFEAGMKSALEAYGESVHRALEFSLERMADVKHRESCASMLSVSSTDRLDEGLLMLRSELG